VALAEGKDLEWALSALSLTEARLAVIRALARREEATLQELQEEIGLSETTLRWHLRHLAEVGLTSTRLAAQGVGRAPVIWRIDPVELERLRALTAQLL
jgi:predicted ArsR family transcriptional regulator